MGEIMLPVGMALIYLFPLLIVGYIVFALVRAYHQRASSPPQRAPLGTPIHTTPQYQEVGGGIQGAFSPMERVPLERRPLGEGERIFGIQTSPMQEREPLMPTEPRPHAKAKTPAIDLRQAMVMKEILDKPVSLRGGRR